LGTDRITAPVEEFSRLTGLGVSPVWKMINEGVLESIRIGRRRLIVVASYDRLIEAQRTAPLSRLPMPKGRLVPLGDRKLHRDPPGSSACRRAASGVGKRGATRFRLIDGWGAGPE